MSTAIDKLKAAFGDAVGTSEFRDNKRSGADTAMTAVIVGVSDGELAALAHYVASR